MPQPEDAPGTTSQLALRYLRGALDTSHPNDQPYVMSEVENRVIRQVKNQAMAQTALVGALGVLIFYASPYFWPTFFAETTLTLSGTTYALPLITILFGLLIVYLEINLLLYLNLQAVRIIMAVCQFPRLHDAQYERHLRALSDAAMDRENRGYLHFGTDPYLGSPDWELTLFFVVTKARAIITTLTLRLLLRASQVSLGSVADLLGMPVAAFWNVWATHAIIRETQVRVMAPHTIREFVDELHEEWHQNDLFCQLIPEALQFVAIPKRQYNYAHLVFTETLMDRFGLTVIRPAGGFLEKLAQAPTDVRQGLERLIIFGALIDGRLSWFERRRLRQLQAKGWLTHTLANIESIGRTFNRGEGLWV